LEEEVRSLRQEVEGSVDVAAIYSVGLSYGKQLAQRFAHHYPQTTVNVEYHHPQRVYELVEAGQADLGLVSCAQASRAIKVIPWLDEPMILVCAPAHPLAQRKELEMSDLQGLAIIGFDPDLQIRRKIDRDLAHHDVQVQVTMAFDNVDTIKRAIEVNAGCSLLPEPSVRSELQAGSLVAVRVRGLDLVRPLGVIVRRGVDLGKTVRRFTQMLRAEGACTADAGEAATHEDHLDDVPEPLAEDGAADGRPKPASRRRTR
jgi:DNA-binding transcriptional LysR family regulator